VGHLRQKYDTKYFLGGVDTDTGRTYGVLGHEKFRAGETHERHAGEFAFTCSLLGSLEGRDVLEVGFGRGDLIPLFLEAGVGSYTGVDFSPSAVEIAESRYKDRRVTLSLTDATKLCTTQVFDLVAMYDLVEHVPVFEMETIWEKIRRALRPGGYVVFSTPIFENPNVSDHTEEIPSVAGIHCHKQTWGTLLRACLKHDFTVAATEERMLGLVRTEDLSLFDARTRERYLGAQASLMAQNGVSRFDGRLTPEVELTLVPGAGRVAVGCVADNNPLFLSQALRLLQSVRWFGGTMAGVSFFICLVDDSDPHYAREFERLGAFVRTVPRVSERHPHSNKLRLLELPEIKAYDTLILLDCDTVVVRDPWDFLDGRSFQAKIADLPTVPQDEFGRAFNHFGFQLPEQEYRCNPSGAPTIWYCNAGVLVFPQPVLEELGSAWRQYNTALLENLDLLGSYAFHCDQVSLSLACAACHVPFRELPLEMNFPLHLTDLESLPAVDRCDPVILHYHDRVDASGYLQPSSYQGAQRRIELLNERLRESRSRSFNNRLFWDFRYTHSPELGSGLGSRGEVLIYKRGLLRGLTQALRPDSILDVGCGDCEVTADLPDRAYTGIDVSPVAVERNRGRMPNRKFISGDFLELNVPIADLVLCFDVLIHLSDARVYRAFVKRLVTRSGKCGLVSGYEKDPNENGGMVFFHEPLSVTLRRFGARSIRKVGQYNKVTVWYYEQAPVRTVRHTLETGLRSPVFVVGCMRSATTLLAKLLGGHPGIVNCPFELKHIWSSVGGVQMASPKTRDTVCPELGADHVEPGQAERLARAFLEETLKESDGKRPDALFLNKNPHLCNKLPFVDALFPDARFIWIHRPMPAVVASVRRLFADVQRRQETWHYWPEPDQRVKARCWHAIHQKEFPTGLDPERVFPGGDIQFIAEYWLESNQAVAAFLPTLPAYRWVEVDEDALIRDPRAQVERCLAMLGQRMDLSFDVTEGIEPPRNDEWKTLLSDEEQKSLIGFMENHQEEIEGVLSVKNPGFWTPQDSLRESRTSPQPSSTTRRKEAPTPPICIAGMHRSGTSMVARLLNQCGLHIGDESDLLEPAPDNPGGYWENARLKELNEEILAQFGGGWDLPPVFEEGWEQRAELDPFRKRAEKLTQELETSQTWGWKDPRNSLTLPFWKTLFPNLRVVVCLRNPLEVAYSLQKRGYSSHAFGFNLWLKYNEQVLAESAPEDKIITHYESYCVNPRDELRRVLDWLGWSVSDAAIDDVCATLSTSLRHYQVSALELFKAGVPQEVLKLYAAMCAHAGPVCQEVLLSQLIAAGDQWRTETETYFAELIEHHPDPIAARLQYALLLQSAGRIEEAIRQYEDILTLDAHNVQANNDIGALYWKQGDQDRAVAHLQECLAVDESNAAALKNLGIIYLALGRTQDAVNVYRKVLSQDPHDVDTLLVLGDLCRKAGKSDKAGFFYGKVLEVDPDNAAAEQGLRTLTS